MRRGRKIKKTIITFPLLLLWGERDDFLKIEMGEESMKYCENGKMEIITGATHWVLREKPGVINPKIIDFLLLRTVQPAYNNG